MIHSLNVHQSCYRTYKDLLSEQNTVYCHTPLKIIAYIRSTEYVMVENCAVQFWMPTRAIFIVSSCANQNTFNHMALPFALPI